MAIPLKQRVQLAIDAGHKVGALAAAAGKKSQAVSQWRSGETKSIMADSAIGLARLTGWSAEWWATGKGAREAVTPPPLPVDDPMAKQLLDAYSVLDEDQRKRVLEEATRMAADKLGRKLLAEKFGVTSAVPDHVVAKSLPPPPTSKAKGTKQ